MANYPPRGAFGPGPGGQVVMDYASGFAVGAPATYHPQQQNTGSSNPYSQPPPTSGGGLTSSNSHSTQQQPQSQPQPPQHHPDSPPPLVSEEDIYRCVKSWFMAINGLRLLLGIFGLLSLTFPSWWIYITGDLVPILCVFLVIEVIGALVGLNSASLEKPHMFITYELIILLLSIYYIFKTGANLYEKRRAIETIIIATLAAACVAQYALAESLRKRLKRRFKKLAIAAGVNGNGHGSGSVTGAGSACGGGGGGGGGVYQTGPLYDPTHQVLVTSNI